MAMVMIATTIDSRSSSVGVAARAVDLKSMARLWRRHNRPMSWMRRHGGWIVAGLLACGLGSVAIARLELARLRDAFDTDMRIAHRLLSQRVVQHDAVLATLALLQPPPQADPAEQRLPALYPQILRVQRRDPGAAWADPRQHEAEVVSRAVRHATLAQLDFNSGRYELVLAAEPASFALLMDLGAVVPWSEWPMQPQTSPVRVTLEHSGQSFVLQPGQAGGWGWRFGFGKHLASDSQPFDVVATRDVGWAELPWLRMLAWSLAVIALLSALRAWQSQRQARQRAEELVRLGQVSRLNALGELAAGMAHELNQPLTAVLANTQAAGRLLADDPPDLETARNAMDQAAQQARRASDVVGRLRRVVEPAAPDASPQPVALQEALRNALYLLDPELAKRQIEPQLQLPADPVRVLAEPVALEQILHNLLMNAMQALEQVPAPERRLVLSVSADKGRGEVTVADSGPGIAPEHLARLFEPFFSTREKGLGLGLSLCETLALGMGGRLTAGANTPRGALFRLALPLVPA
jgi:signal transduction histidine kinase